MPELPEVQTIIDTLNHSGLLNHKIKDVKVYKLKLLKNSTFNIFKKFLINEKIKNITRVGKFLIFHLSNKKTMVVHLRMEGKLFYEKEEYTIPMRHLRIEFFLDNKHVLRYYDSRIFGTFHIYTNDDWCKDEQIAKLGLDPLNKLFNGKYLYDKLAKSNIAIKTALLDQTNVSGIGNIYADEILFKCKIHPSTPSKNINLSQCNMIAKQSKLVLQKAIKYKGTTIATYKSDKDHSGEFQKFLMVHGRKGEPCYICKTIIQKIKLNGRGTYFCPKCQELK